MKRRTYVADSAAALLEGLDTADAEPAGAAAPLHAADVVALSAGQAGAHQSAASAAILVLCGATREVGEVDHAEDGQHACKERHTPMQLQVSHIQLNHTDF